MGICPENKIETSTVCTSATDVLKHFFTFRSNFKIHSFDICLNKKTIGKCSDGTQSNLIDVITGTSNNIIEKHRITLENKNSSSVKVNSIDTQGHREGSRAITLSKDGKLLVSCSKKSIKLWNIQTRHCIRTIESGFGLCVLFAPGGKHVIIGTKEGMLQLFDISASIQLEEVKAHEGEVWSLSMRSDGKRFVSGGADHLVKIWDFELIQDNKYSKITRRLGFVHETTLKMSDDVLCVKYSPDSKYLAVALLDCTIKIFFQDSLKFFCSLYGHKLPITKFDISDDSTLLVSVSADKNIKLWGLDFGDCHKSIFGHSDTILDVHFVPNTHYFFTSGKDKLIKYWDGDTFQNILTLRGHQSQVWSLTVSEFGHCLVSSSHDRSFRLWERTSDIVYIKIERELEREKELNSFIIEDQNKHEMEDEEQKEVFNVGKQTEESLYSSEKIIDAIELCDTEEEQNLKYKEDLNKKLSKGKEISLERSLDPRFIISKCKTPSEYLLHVMKAIKSNDLEESLLVIPFSYSLRLLHYINDWLENGYEIELSCRCLFFLVKLHHQQLTTNHEMMLTLDRLRKTSFGKISELKNIIGFNLAGLEYLRNELKGKEFKFFGEAETNFIQSVKKKRRKIVL